MIRRSTIVYILILLAIVGTYFYLNNREKSSADVLVTPEATEKVNYLFTAGEGVPTGIHLETRTGEAVELARDADNAWALILPFAARAEQGSSEAAASQLTTIRIFDRVPGIDPKIAGLETPEYILTARFNNNVERTVNIGVVTPSESGYYVRFASGGDVLIVSKSSVDSLLTLLTMPPYLETPTPSPTATETPLPMSTPEAASPADETATPKQ